MGGWLKGLCVGAGCFGLLGACAEDVDSANVKTAGMYADLTVTARENGQSEVRAAILIGGRNSNTYAKLSAGDVLTATSGDETRTLTEVGGTVGDVHIYQATFTGVEEGKQFTLGFERADDESAPDSNTMLPAPFVISAPMTGVDVSRAEPLTVSWTPASSESVSVSVDGDCVIIESDTVSSDTGSHTFAANSIQATAGNDGETCEVELTVSTRASGSVDPAFGEGGHFDAVQERTITFRSTP